MKKLLIGCGCLVLLLGGGLAYLVFSMAPMIEHQDEVQERVTGELRELDSAHPFAANPGGELDSARFEQALKLRAALVQRLAQLEADRRATEDNGVTSLIPNMLARMNALVESIPAVLGEHELGPSELQYHTSVFWAALAKESADSEPELVELRRRYSELKGAWSFLRQNHPRLDELPRLIDGPSQPILDAARAVLAANAELADDGVLEAIVEGVLLTLPDLDSGCMEAFASQRMAEITNRTFGDS
jgi:hypothetical protein